MKPRSVAWRILLDRQAAGPNEKMLLTKTLTLIKSLLTKVTMFQKNYKEYGRDFKYRGCSLRSRMLAMARVICAFFDGTLGVMTITGAIHPVTPEEQQ